MVFYSTAGPHYLLHPGEGMFVGIECRRLFKKVTGETIFSCLQSYRLAQSAHLLRHQLFHRGVQGQIRRDAPPIPKSRPLSFGGQIKGLLQKKHLAQVPRHSEQNGHPVGGRFAWESVSFLGKRIAAPVCALARNDRLWAKCGFCNRPFHVKYDIQIPCA